MSIYQLSSGKYEVIRDDLGLILDVKRNGEHWPAGFEMIVHSNFIHSMLNEIDRLLTDAIRYDWLRSHTVYTGLSSWMKHHQFLDTAVDLAIAAETKARMLQTANDWIAKHNGD